MAIDLGSGGNVTRNVIIKDNVLLNRVPNNIYTGLHIGDVEISGNVIGFASHGIANVYGDNVSVTDNRFIGNGENYHTGPRATRTTYENNSEIAGSEENGLCYRVKKFTDPHRACLPDLQ